MASLMSAIETSPKREFLCLIPYDADLLPSLKDLVKKLGVNTGVINFIGALRGATLLYYIQDEKRFHKTTLEGPLEIASGMGNIATLEGDHVVHCHVVLADKDGSCYGGHLAEGSRVFAAEVHIRELSPRLQRKYDDLTGLNLLQI